MSRSSKFRRVALWVAVVFYVAAGVFHFAKPAPYLKIMPPFVPAHLAMVYISGAFEILGGLGLALPVTRRAAGWGLAVLLVAVFPANVFMAVDPVRAGAASIRPEILWARLALQPLLIWWVLWCSRNTEGGA
jgi:uncharacterized membrane protein